MDRNENLIQVLENEQFLTEAQNMETVGDFQTLLARYGLELSLEEVYAFCEYAVCANAGELNAEDLVAVAGGKAKRRSLLKTFLTMTCYHVMPAGSLYPTSPLGKKKSRKK